MRYFTDTGVVLRKRRLMDNNQLITILSRQNGKLTLMGFGVKSLKSRRLSHIETGNYIKFSFIKKNSYYTLGETELIYGYTKIKRTPSKMDLLFLLFVILDNILPEDQHDEIVFEKTFAFLKRLNNKEDVNHTTLKLFLSEVLLQGGFIDKSKVSDSTFDSLGFIEELIGRRLTRDPIIKLT